MRGNEFLDKLALVDSAFIEEAEQRPATRTAPMRWIAAVACVCLVAAGVWGAYRLQQEPPQPIEPPTSPTESTSDTYVTLEELLTYLSRNDSHADTKGEGRGSTAVTDAQVTEGAMLVGYQQYTYHITDSGVVISDVSGDTPIQAAVLHEAAEQLLVCGDTLVLVNSVHSGDLPNRQTNTIVKLYTLTQPTAPQQMRELVQAGQRCAIYADGGALYLLTTDGMCACGWSREDTEAYVPQLTVDGDAVVWEDADFAVLGEPSRVEYVAAVKLDAGTGALLDKQAYYGDIDTVFFGQDWMSIVTQTYTSQQKGNPDLYWLDTQDGFAYAGKTDVSATMDIAHDVTPTDGVLPDGVYPYIRAVAKADDGVYRIIGEVTTVTQKQNTSQLLAMTVDITAQQTEYVLHTSDIGSNFTVDDLVWERDRAIVTLSRTAAAGNDVWSEARFVTVDFDGMAVSAQDTSLRVERVDGIDGIVQYGSPFSELQAMIPLGNGVYLRYNGVPNGLDILDFSGESPVRLYEATDMTENGRLAFTAVVCNETTFGIMVITPDENGELRQATRTWQVYTVDVHSDAPYTLIRSVDLEGEGFYVSGEDCATLELNGQYYFASSGTATVQRLTI